MTEIMLPREYWSSQPWVSVSLVSFCPSGTALFQAPDCSHPGWAELYRSDGTNEGPHGCGPKRHSEEEPCRASRTLKPRPPSRAQQPRTEPAHLRLPKSRPPPVSAVRN